MTKEDGQRLLTESMRACAESVTLLVACQDKLKVALATPEKDAEGKDVYDAPAVMHLVWLTNQVIALDAAMRKLLRLNRLVA